MQNITGNQKANKDKFTVYNNRLINRLLEEILEDLSQSAFHIIF